MKGSKTTLLSALAALTVVGVASCSQNTVNSQMSTDAVASTVSAEPSDRDLLKYYLHSRINGVFDFYYKERDSSPVYYMSNYILPDYLREKESSDYRYYTNSDNIFRYYEAVMRKKYERLDRSPQNITRQFNQHKDILYAILSRDKYRDYRIDLYVDTLIGTYNNMQAVPDYKNTFAKLRHERCTSVYEIEQYQPCMTFIEPLMDVDLIPLFNNKPNYRTAVPFENGFVNSDDEAAINMVLFWYRRHLDGNSEAVYDILKDIQAHYES